MGRNFTLHLNHQVADYLDQEENKSKLVSDLLKKHYSKVVESPRDTISRINENIKDLEKQKKSKMLEHEEELALETKSQEEQNAIQEKKLLLNKWVDLWKSEQIDDETYYSAFPEGKFVRDIAMEILEKLK